LDLLAQTKLRDVLSLELNSRVQKNKSYSLRSFARDLEISPSSLSDVIKGKSGGSASTLNKIANCLNLNDHEAGYIKNISLAEFAKCSVTQDKARAELERLAALIKIKHINKNEAAGVFDYRALALLELLALKRYQRFPGMAAARLGLSEESFEKALKMLLQKKLISKNENGLNF